MPRKALPKTEYTTEEKERQLKMRAFLRGVSEIQWRELRPFGFSINVGTIPKDKVEEFLSIANSLEKIK